MSAGVSPDDPKPGKCHVGVVRDDILGRDVLGHPLADVGQDASTASVRPSASNSTRSSARFRIVHQLTVAQSATFVNAEGVTVRVSAEPKEHTFRFEEVKDEDFE